MKLEKDMELKCRSLHERSQPEKLHTLWFQLYDILGKQNYKKISGCQALRAREGWIGEYRRFWGQ